MRIEKEGVERRDKGRRRRRREVEVTFLWQV